MQIISGVIFHFTSKNQVREKNFKCQDECSSWSPDFMLLLAVSSGPFLYQHDELTHQQPEVDVLAEVW